MKVFLAWSGAASEELAKFFHGWLPEIVQAIDPFMSTESIRKGSQWQNDIGTQLADTKFALLCLTPSNLRSPWIHFEAGAASKNIQQAHVSALLGDVTPTDIEFPLQQFQNTPLTEPELWKLMKDLNSLCGTPMPETRLLKAFERAFPDLEKALQRIRKTLAAEVSGLAQRVRKTEEILEDMLSVQQALVAKIDALESNRLPDFGNLYPAINARQSPGLGSSTWASQLVEEIDRARAAGLGQTAHVLETTAMEVARRSMTGEAIKQIRDLELSRAPKKKK